MFEIYIPIIEGKEKKITLEEFYAMLSFLESMEIYTNDMLLSYSDSKNEFILSKVLKNDEEMFKNQNVYFRFDLENDSFIVKNEIKGNMYDNNKKTLCQDFAKFIKNGDSLERYTVSFYQAYDEDEKPENYDLYIANFLDFYYDRYGEMGNLVNVPIIKDYYEVSNDYKITLGVNNNKMVKKRG